MLTKRPPNTIHLGGEITKLNEWSAGVAITPGMEIESYSDGGKMKWRPVTGNTTGAATGIFALEKLIHNKTVDDIYAIGELVLAAQFHSGSLVWALVPTGADIATADLLKPNGNGMLSEATLAGDIASARYQAEETLGVTAATTRCKVRVRS